MSGVLFDLKQPSYPRRHSRLFWYGIQTRMSVCELRVYRPLSARIWLYQRQKVMGGELSLPSEGRPAIY